MNEMCIQRHSSGTKLKAQDQFSFEDHQIHSIIGMSEAITPEEFVVELYEVPDWFTLGIFLGVDELQLRQINRSENTNRCLVEVFSLIKRLDIELSWRKIAEALEKMKYFRVARNIRQKYLSKPALSRQASDKGEMEYSEQLLQEEMKPTTPNSIMGGENTKEVEGGNLPHTIELNHKYTKHIHAVFLRFSALETIIITALKQAMDVETLQIFITSHFQLSSIPSTNTTITSVLHRLRSETEHHEYLQFLESLVENFLDGNHSLMEKIHSYEAYCERKQLTLPLENMLSKIPKHSGEQSVEVKLLDEWKRVILSKFDAWIKSILKRSYPHLSLMRVTGGCVCVSWLTTNTEDVVQDVQESRHVLRLSGVISVSVGGKLIFVEQENDGDRCVYYAATTESLFGCKDGYTCACNGGEEEEQLSLVTQSCAQEKLKGRIMLEEVMEGVTQVLSNNSQ